MSEIDFPNVEKIDPATFHVAFPAIVDGKQISCIITSEALQANFIGDHSNKIEIFQNNRSTIENKVQELIGQNRYENDGSIFVRTADFES